MLSPLRNRFGIPGVISVVALVFAMFGGAYAASSDNGGEATASKTKIKKVVGPKGPRGATGPAGPAGPKGDTGAAGANGSNGSAGAPGKDGTNGKTILNGIGAPAAGLGSVGDFYIDTEENEIYGPKAATWGPGTSLKGEEGSPWTVGGTLPHGQTETGTWSGILSEGEFGPEALVPISFTIPLEAALDFNHTIKVPAGDPPTSHCTGGTVLNPKADPGYLCVYTAPAGADALGVASPGIVNSGTGTSGALISAGGGTLGESAGGSWAVTAP
jgi:collagen triple helix repeat protein